MFSTIVLKRGLGLLIGRFFTRVITIPYLALACTLLDFCFHESHLVGTCMMFKCCVSIVVGVNVVGYMFYRGNNLLALVSKGSS